MSPTPNPNSDPRVFFAAERTLLAWVRTGLTIMALGFVVSRFGLFVRLLELQAPAAALEAVGALLGLREAGGGEGDGERAPGEGAGRHRPPTRSWMPTT